jgi:hypothetical protein
MLTSPSRSLKSRTFSSSIQKRFKSNMSKSMPERNAKAKDELCFWELQHLFVLRN